LNLVIILLSSLFGFKWHLLIMGNIFRSWPRGLVLFLQPARMNPFGRAEKDQNAAAAPDALKGSALAWTIVAAPAKTEKKLINGGC